jgi:hypothetical protein
VVTGDHEESTVHYILPGLLCQLINRGLNNENLINSLGQHMSKRIILTPSAGFVVKTTSQEPGIYTPTSLPEKQPSPNSLEPVLHSTPVTDGFKIFINIAFHQGVPPPPRSSESDIRKAMAGDENAYFVPIIVSDGREVTDKGELFSKLSARHFMIRKLSLLLLSIKPENLR